METIQGKSFSLNSFGRVALIAGSLLFAIYSALFAVLLSLHADTIDFVQAVLNPNRRALALMALDIVIE